MTLPPPPPLRRIREGISNPMYIHTSERVTPQMVERIRAMTSRGIPSASPSSVPPDFDRIEQEQAKGRLRKWWDKCDKAKLGSRLVWGPLFGAIGAVVLGLLTAVFVVISKQSVIFAILYALFFISIGIGGYLMWRYD
jgi:hypothetical protein